MSNKIRTVSIEDQMEELTLSRCPFCGGAAEMSVALPVYGRQGCFIKCTVCGANVTGGNATQQIIKDRSFATPVTLGSLMDCIRIAYGRWNSRRNVTAVDLDEE